MTTDAAVSFGDVAADLCITQRREHLQTRHEAHHAHHCVRDRSHRRQGAPPFHAGTRDPAGAVEVKLNAGDAVVFQQGLWHAAAPIHSQQTRVLLYYGYGYGYRIFRQVDNQRMAEHVLAGRSGVERQLLGETVTHQGPATR